MFRGRLFICDLGTFYPVLRAFLIISYNTCKTLLLDQTPGEHDLDRKSTLVNGPSTLLMVETDDYVTGFFVIDPFNHQNASLMFLKRQIYKTSHDNDLLQILTVCLTPGRNSFGSHITEVGSMTNWGQHYRNSVGTRTRTHAKVPFVNVADVRLSFT